MHLSGCPSVRRPGLDALGTFSVCMLPFTQSYTRPC